MRLKLPTITVSDETKGWFGMLVAWGIRIRHVPNNGIFGPIKWNIGRIGWPPSRSKIVGFGIHVIPLKMEFQFNFRKCSMPLLYFRYWRNRWKNQITAAFPSLRRRPKK